MRRFNSASVSCLSEKTIDRAMGDANKALVNNYKGSTLLSAPILFYINRRMSIPPRIIEDNNRGPPCERKEFMDGRYILSARLKDGVVAAGEPRELSQFLYIV